MLYTFGYMGALPIPSDSLSVAITTRHRMELRIDTAIIVCRYLRTPIAHVRLYLPKFAGVKERNVYAVLIMIAATPTSTMRHIEDNIGSKHCTVQKAVEQLLLLRYIKPVKRTRLIIPFNAYKQDTGYVLTVKGKTVVKQLLDY